MGYLYYVVERIIVLVSYYILVDLLILFILGCEYHLYI